MAGCCVGKLLEGALARLKLKHDVEVVFAYVTAGKTLGSGHCGRSILWKRSELSRFPNPAWTAGIVDTGSGSYLLQEQASNTPLHGDHAGRETDIHLKLTNRVGLRVSAVFPERSQYTLHGNRSRNRFPSRYNVEAYVIKLAICPENANCFLPDGIVIADSREPDDERKTRRIAVQKPRQFVEGHRYLISLSVTDPADRNLDENLLDIMGYSRIE